jgi:hypothetical protein
MHTETRRASRKGPDYLLLCGFQLLSTAIDCCRLLSARDSGFNRFNALLGLGSKCCGEEPMAEGHFLRGYAPGKFLGGLIMH